MHFLFARQYPCAPFALSPIPLRQSVVAARAGISPTHIHLVVGVVNKAARRAQKKKRGARANSNVFARFDQDQIAEFQEV